MSKRGSFFERLTGSVRLDDENELMDEGQGAGGPSVTITPKSAGNGRGKKATATAGWMENEPEEGQLTVDVYQTPTEIVVQTMVAGVRPEDLQITITRDMITIHGRREESKTIDEDNYFARELYWGSFSRSISLPQEVEPEEAEAVEKHGLLTVRMPKIDKGRQTTLKVKSM